MAALIILPGCDKDSGLTPATQEGKNTFSCKVNGKVWVPDGSKSPFSMVKAINGGFFNNSIDDSIRIWISTYKDNKEEIHIYLSAALTGQWELNKDTSPVGASFRPKNYGLFRSSSKTEFITSASNIGTVTITRADTSTGILSGTFEFSAADFAGSLVKVTDGRFDINTKNR